MAMVPKEICYLSANPHAACIEFYPDKHHCRAFKASQLIEFSLDPNPDADANKNEPPQKITLVFATADVVVLGWHLGLIADNLRDNKLSAIGILSKRYAGLEGKAVFVSSITITPISN